MRKTYVIALIPALVAVVFGVIAYFAPMGNTGVDGSIGALLALVGASATAIGALLAMLPALRGGLLVLLNVLMFLAAALTAVAAYFLMQFVMAVAMVLAFVGLCLALFLHSRKRPA